MAVCTVQSVTTPMESVTVTLDGLGRIVIKVDVCLLSLHPSSIVPKMYPYNAVVCEVGNMFLMKFIVT